MTIDALVWPISRLGEGLTELGSRRRLIPVRAPIADPPPQCAAIRGGIPVCWPQFSNEGPLPPHGFARNLPWEVIDIRTNDDQSRTATLHLTDSPTTRDFWPHSFVATIAVTVGGNRLRIAFSVTNTGRDDFTFSGSLHTYLRVERAARILDLEPEGYRRMLCIEAGVVGTPVRLGPGESWQGGQRIEVE